VALVNAAPGAGGPALSKLPSSGRRPEGIAARRRRRARRPGWGMHLLTTRRSRCWSSSRRSLQRTG